MGFLKSLPSRNKSTLLGVLLSTLTVILCLFASSLAGQVFTVEPEDAAAQVGTFQKFHPTTVKLATEPLREITREQLIRIFQSDTAYAMIPLPLGKQGLEIEANGPMKPEGKNYLEELNHYGISSKPGDRVMISKFEIKSDRIVFEFNGGPEKHHHLLQHVEIGIGSSTSPMAQDSGEAPIGSRLTLVFDKYVPEMRAFQVRNLLAPILDFSLKTPAEAYAETLPAKLRDAILNHEVLVGMNREMVLHAVGSPEQRVRETNADGPFEEWIYGSPPHEVQFVRFRNHRVVRLEIADVGQSPIIRDHDETGGYLGPVAVHRDEIGDAVATVEGEDPKPRTPPTLRRQGESLPDAIDQQRSMKPVQFPTDSQGSPKQTPPG